jgi:hypothetical protein
MFGNGDGPYYCIPFGGDQVVSPIICDFCFAQPWTTQQHGIICFQNFVIHNKKCNYVWDAMYVYFKILN